MKKALVCGAGGFIGGHLVEKLKNEGYWVRGVDLKGHEFSNSPADQFLLLDLREQHNCWSVVQDMDEVYQLAADMGGMGFISNAECEIMHNNVLINTHMINAATKADVERFFFSSSVCVYRDMESGEPALKEEKAYPAFPDNEYGWEKLYAERMTFSYARHYPIQVRVARFQNCYGPKGTWRGGREKAPAAICRKVALAENDSKVDVWGDGKAVRSYTYVSDLVDGIFKLMHSNLEGPTNIGSDEFISVEELVKTVIKISGKDLGINYIEGPVGVQYRNFDKSKIKSIGWEARIPFSYGISKTYFWVKEEIERWRAKGVKN